MKLSSRLQAIYNMVPKAVTADIGADHGKLIISLFENHFSCSQFIISLVFVLNRINYIESSEIHIRSSIFIFLICLICCLKFLCIYPAIFKCYFLGFGSWKQRKLLTYINIAVDGVYTNELQIQPIFLSFKIL